MPHPAAPLDDVLATATAATRPTPSGSTDVEVAVARWDGGAPTIRVAQVRRDRQGRPFARRALAGVTADEARQLAAELVRAAAVVEAAMGTPRGVASTESGQVARDGAPSPPTPR